MTKQKHAQHDPAPAQEDIQQPQSDLPQEDGAQEGAVAEQLAKSQAQAEEYLEMAQRVQAEFDNYRRRNQGVRAEAVEDGAREVLTQMLPVVDNLERAVEAALGDKNPYNDGVEMVLKQLRDVMGKFGVTEISRKGEPFDPEQEHAVLQGTPEDGEPGTVCDVLQKGYRTPKRVLRPSMVKVVTG